MAARNRACIGAIFGLILVFAGPASAATRQSGPVFDAWSDFMWNYYYSAVMSYEDFTSGNLRLDEWAHSQGVAFRLQWDKAEAMPDVVETSPGNFVDNAEKFHRKRVLELLWQDLLAQMNEVGQQDPRADSTQMVNWLKEGFFANFWAGKGQFEQALAQQGLDDPTKVVSFFDYYARRGGGGGGGGPPPEQQYACTVDLNKVGNRDGFCSTFVERFNDYRYTVHVVGHDNQGKLLIGTPPSTWQHGRYNTCTILERDAVTECQLWIDKNFR